MNKTAQECSQHTHSWSTRHWAAHICANRSFWLHVWRQCRWRRRDIKCWRYEISFIRMIVCNISCNDIIGSLAVAFCNSIAGGCFLVCMCVCACATVEHVECRWCEKACEKSAFLFAYYGNFDAVSFECESFFFFHFLCSNRRVIVAFLFLFSLFLRSTVWNIMCIWENEWVRITWGLRARYYNHNNINRSHLQVEYMNIEHASQMAM